jgi:hypothetical protein
MVLLSIFILVHAVSCLETVSDACCTIPSPPDDRVSMYCKIFTIHVFNLTDTNLLPICQLGELPFQHVIRSHINISPKKLNALYLSGMKSRTARIRICSSCKALLFLTIMESNEFFSYNELRKISFLDILFTSCPLSRTVFQLHFNVPTTTPWHIGSLSFFPSIDNRHGWNSSIRTQSRFAGRVCLWVRDACSGQRRMSSLVLCQMLRRWMWNPNTFGGRCPPQLHDG